MPLTIEEIKALEAIDLNNFEIRGAKFGIGNARSTGPLKVRGTFSPSETELTGTATFSPASDVVTGISFNAPFSGLDAEIFVGNDTVTASSTDFKVVEVLSSTSVKIDQNSGLTGSLSFECSLISREYLLEPDIFNNTTTGTATFTNGDENVVGSGTSWLSEVAVGDFIKLNDYQKYYIVDSVVSNALLKLTEDFGGPTATGSYTHKRRKLGRLKVQYTKNDFDYNKRNGRWEYDSTTGSNISTSASSYVPLVDGIQLKFTSAIDPDDPDLMESGLELNKVFAQSTENELFQFSLPAVPFPEDSLEVYIDNKLVDRFPDGDQDYVVNYSQDPIYRTSPPVEERSVANLMFLEGITDQTLSTTSTESGVIIFTDAQGNNLSGIMPGSEDIQVDGTSLELYKDYVLDLNTGQAYASEHVTDETLVDHVALNHSDLVDNGFQVTLDGQVQQVSIPSQTTDDILFNFEEGKLRPANKSHPGPGEEYIVDYLVDSNQISNELITTTVGMTAFRVSRYPVKSNSVILFKNGNLIDENEDFRVSYSTGRVVLFDPLIEGDRIQVSYTALSKQRNGLSFEEGKNYCTVYGSRTSIRVTDPPEFALSNQSLIDDDSLEILRVYNDTKNKAYDLTGIVIDGNLIRLQSNAINDAIDTESSDIVVADYKFEHNGTEYAPVVTLNLSVLSGTNKLYIEGRDAANLFPVNGLVRLNDIDSEGDYFFKILSSSFDGEDTAITFDGSAPTDIVNPILFATEDIVDFTQAPFSSSGVVTGSNEVRFPGENISNIFRTNAVLSLSDDYYVIRTSEYDRDGTETVVTLGVQAYTDYTDSSAISGIMYSTVPVYYEGDTELTTAKEIVESPDAPAMTLNFLGEGSVTVSSDATSLAIDTTSSQYVFPYSSYPTIGSLATGLDTTVADLTATTYVTDWSSSKIITLTDQAVSADSSTLISVGPALRLDGTDTEDFEIVDGVIVLENPLESGQRYNFDYLGTDFLGDSSVKFSARTFTSLPEGSKISASLEFSNLDQFYIQVISQLDFLEQVTQPRMEEEANQQNGNIGQGGELPGDEDLGNSEGGITGDEFRRQDTEIECRVFNNIFDFFNERLQAYGDERYAATGYKLLNNDGVLSESDESGCTKAFSRIFTDADYTNFEPMYVAPLTGQCIPPGATAIFTNGSSDVTSKSSSFGFPTYWETQLKAGDFIRLAGTTKDYTVSSITNDARLTLDSTFEENSSPDPNGVSFAMTSKYPLYDDDGHVGAKIEGNKSNNFNLVSGDVFDAYVDGDYKSYTFTDPPSAFFTPLSLYSAQDAAREVNSIAGIRADASWIWDPAETYGYRTVIVVRSDTTNNCLVLGSGSAVTKLGFVPDTSSCGNLDTTDSSSESLMITEEASHFPDESTYISNLITAGASNKLDRVTAGNIVNADGILTEVTDESAALVIAVDRLEEEIAATGILIQESSLSSYTDNSAAHLAATNAYNDATVALEYADSIVTDWEDTNDATKWVLDLEEENQYIRGKNGSDVGVDTSTGIGIVSINGETSFKLEVPSAYDQRILNAVVDSTEYRPSLFFVDSGAQVDGTWTGWDAGVSDEYSTTNQITFTLTDTTTLFTLSTAGTFDYSIDKTALNIIGVSTTVIDYATYSTISSVKSAVNAISGISASGSAVHDSSSSEGLKLVSQTSVGASTPIFNGLRESQAFYATISDEKLDKRDDFITDRSSEISSRLSFLVGTRDSQITAGVSSEELLRATDGETGNIYSWADNRWNRSNGCEARLKQIERQIERNESSLNVSKRII